MINIQSIPSCVNIGKHIEKSSIFSAAKILRSSFHDERSEIFFKSDKKYLMKDLEIGNVSGFLWTGLQAHNRVHATESI